jgi:hypothetical protein
LIAYDDAELKYCLDIFFVTVAVTKKVDSRSSNVLKARNPDVDETRIHLSSNSISLCRNE